MKITIKNSSWDIIKTIDAKLNQTLLKTITESWIEIYSACLNWICASCMCQIESWEQFVLKTFRNEPSFPLADEEVMTCIAKIKDEFIETNNELILKTIY